ncbi:MAG: 4Fe-4S binding protein [Deltaproteobacteria bacterium]|nr:4Fe-4S binding protein [Deltaproteobacteria bacterium]
MNTRYSGFAGRLLDVDLSARSQRDFPLTDRLLELYLGGKALGARILWDELQPGIDPLSPQNILVFTVGPLTGSGAPASSRFNLSTKNVLTGGILSSNCGGQFGVFLKRAGYDGLVVRGRADAPVWLAIDERGARFLDARHLWGLDTEVVQHSLSPKLGRLVIGPAGENLVRYAAIVSGERVLGRGGTGAVMGSKNLKLVTASGARSYASADEPAFRSTVKKWVSTLRGHSITGRQLPRYGTAALVSGTSATNTLPTRNFRFGTWDKAEEVSGLTMAERHLARNDGCLSCPIRCGRVVRWQGRERKGPEFETIGMLGPNIVNPDLEKIIEWNLLADALGLDTITLGSTLATAMELKERGLLPELPVSFEDSASMTQLIEDIAYRRGIGDELAEGSLRMARRRGAPELSMSSKGMEFAAYEPRGAVGHGLGYAVSNRGGCHINGGYLVFFEALGPLNIDPLTPLAKPALTVFQQNTMEAVAAAGGCIFTTYAVIPDVPSWAVNPHGLAARLTGQALKLTRFLLGSQGKMKPDGMPFHLPLLPHSKALATWTGMKMNLGLFSAVGERGYTLERLFNLREGILADEDALPPRMTDEPQRPRVPESRVPLAEMLPVYYQVRDWDARGVPTLDLLRKLDLDDAAPVVADLGRAPETFRDRRRRLLDGERDVLRGVLADSRRWADEAGRRRDELRSSFERSQARDWAVRVRRSWFDIDFERCKRCGLCAKACPVDAIEWRRGGKARLVQEKCIRCGLCHQACPPHFDAVVLRDVPADKDRSTVRYLVVEPKCEKCGLCWKKCPVPGAISWRKGELAFIHDDVCVACGRCVEACPEKFGAVVLVDDRRVDDDRR